MTVNSFVSTEVSILIDNAVKYNEENGKIHINAYKNNHNVVFKNENSFPEKPSDNSERLFEGFYRGDKARTQSKVGCGIGFVRHKSYCRGKQRKY